MANSASEGIDLQDQRITDYPGTGLITGGLLFVQDPQTRKAHRATADRVGGSGGTPLPTRNAYAVPAAKRKQVADAIIAKVNNNGQAFLDEPDGQWLGCIIVDNRTTTDRTIITCHQQANPSTGAAEFCWYRSVVQ